MSCTAVDPQSRLTLSSLGLVGGLHNRPYIDTFSKSFGNFDRVVALGWLLSDALGWPLLDRAGGGARGVFALGPRRNGAHRTAAAARGTQRAALGVVLFRVWTFAHLACYVLIKVVRYSYYVYTTVTHNIQVTVSG